MLRASALSLALLLAQLLTALKVPGLVKDGPPVDPTGVQEINSTNGARIRYKQPGKQGLCQSTVDDYAGYISLNERTNLFFWFFEAEENPNEKPLTLWLNGGPGSDSMIGLFQENGPCNISEDLQATPIPYSWNRESNMLYLSQPVGVGYSYETTNTTEDGRYSLVDPTTTNNTYAAAVGAWHILQAFLELSPRLDSDITNRTFNLATESYGGHYGPTFFNYFYEQNERIVSGEIPGTALHMNSLLIINAVISFLVQGPSYPEFAVNNTYGVKGVPDDVYLATLDAFYRSGGCQDQILACNSQTLSERLADPIICVNAFDFCRDEVEGPFYQYSGRGVYDIRIPDDVTDPPEYFVDFLNLASTQEAVGVNINYTSDNAGIVLNAFYGTGDWIYDDFQNDLEQIIDRGTSVSLVFGDADYICNWFGGEAISLALNHSTSDEFRASGYTPYLVDGQEFGAVRQYGKYSFTRLYDAGHKTPYYQPEPMLELFRRLINGLIIADGSGPATDDYATVGPSTSIHTEPFPAIDGDTEQ